MLSTTTAITPEELLDLKVVAEHEQLQEMVATAAQKFRRMLAAVDQEPKDTQKDVLNRQIL